jgi:hypothetical protein
VAGGHRPAGGHAFTPPRARRGSAPRSDGPSRRHGAHSERTCEIFEVACGPRDDDVVPGLPQHSRRLRQTRTGKTLHLLGAPLEVLERRLDVTERRRDRGIRARARGGRGDRLGRICQTVRPPEQVGRIPGAPRTIRSLGSLCDTDSSRERGHAGNRATASLAPVSDARCTSRVWRSRVHERVRCQALPLIYTPGPIVRVRFRPQPVRVWPRLPTSTSRSMGGVGRSQRRQQHPHGARKDAVEACVSDRGLSASTPGAGRRGL